MPGVLPYTFVNGEAYFLFGRERGGNDKGTWSILSGGRDKGDVSDKMAACREAHEESAGLLGSIEDIAKQVFSLNGSSQTYMMEVKDPSVITSENFLKARAKYKDPHYREMSEVKWMKASEVVDACVKNKGFFPMNGKQEQIRPFVSKIFAKNAGYLKTNQFVQDKPKPSLIEIHSIKQIDTKNIDKDTLVLVDVDETLLIDKNHKRKNIDAKHLGNKPYIPIENDIADLMSTIKKINGEKTVLGLTKRPYQPHQSADKQIQELKIPFSRHRFKHLNAQAKNSFNNGVIYTAGGDKGQRLQSFLNEAGFVPKNIVMIDDRADNLESVRKMAEALNIPVTNYHMKGADKFNLAVK